MDVLVIIDMRIAIAANGFPLAACGYRHAVVSHDARSQMLSRAVLSAADRERRQHTPCSHGPEMPTTQCGHLSWRAVWRRGGNIFASSRATTICCHAGLAAPGCRTRTDSFGHSHRLRMFAAISRPGHCTCGSTWAPEETITQKRIAACSWGSALCGTMPTFARIEQW